MNAANDNPMSPKYRLHALIQAYWQITDAELVDILDILGPPRLGKPAFPSTDAAIYRAVPDLARVELNQKISDDRRECEHRQVMRGLRYLAVAVLLAGLSLSLTIWLVGCAT